jgi:hypothetical protein
VDHLLHQARQERRQPGVLDRQLNKLLGKILVEQCTYSSDPVERFIQAMLVRLDKLKEKLKASAMEL